MNILARAVLDRAAETPDAIAFVDGITQEKTTYRALVDRSARIADRLRSRHGVVRGDRVAVLAHNHVRTFETLLACSRLGAALVPLNHRLSDLELVTVLERCEPRVLFADGAHADRVGPHPKVPFEDASLLGDHAYDAIDGALEDALVVLFTSGTTGLPKGALLPQRALAANAASTRHAWGLVSSDVALVDAPLFHTGGLNVLATPLLYVGGTSVVLPRFDAAVSGETIVRERCSIVFGVPQMLERLLGEGFVDRAAVRLYVTGGAPCPRSLLDAFAQRGVRLVQGFGMTECGPNCFQPTEGGAPGFLGVPTTGLEARLVDDAGHDVAEGDAGELLLRGPHVFLGYFRDEAATRAAKDGDGWLHTGDVLRATPEGWCVAGRKKEMFISGGENVYPAEVEAAIMMHAGVAEAAVVSAPDPKWGEVGIAYVLPRDPAAPPTPEALRAFARERIAAYKVPRTVFVLAELPRTSSNKIDKRALAARHA